MTLELGGKSPAIVLEGADLTVGARRLIWGKGINAGQTCSAPDHLLVPPALRSPLLKAMERISQSQSLTHVSCSAPACSVPLLPIEIEGHERIRQSRVPGT